MKKKVFIGLVAVLLLFLTCVILRQNKELNEYKSTFDVKGTYTSGKNNSDYLVFSEDNVFYSYQQFGKKIKGSYIKLKTPNTYVLKIKGVLKGYIFIQKESLTLMENERSLNYQKVSKGKIYINI